MKLKEILRKVKHLKNLSDLKSSEIEHLIKHLKWRDWVIVCLSILCLLFIIF